MNPLNVPLRRNSRFERLSAAPEQLPSSQLARLTRVCSTARRPCRLACGQPSVSEVACIQVTVYIRSISTSTSTLHVRALYTSGRCNHERAGLRDNDSDSCGVKRCFHRASYDLPAKDLVKASIYVRHEGSKDGALKCCPYGQC